MELLSDIELFYSEDVFPDKIILSSDELHHCIKVFRKTIGDEIFITDGKGNIYNCRIEKISDKELFASILNTKEVKVKFQNFNFCIPILRNKDRFRFALEKLIELGISNIIIFKASRSVPDKVNTDKIKKIAIEAIKQSLQANLPSVRVINRISDLSNFEGNKIIFHQRSQKKFSVDLINKDVDYFFIFGPEGGLTDEEINSLNNSQLCSIADNRLRTETAILKVASIITQ